MSGSIDTVRGSVALSWAWNGDPMASEFALNVTVPPNVVTSVVVPVPGLAAHSLVVTEGRTPVWRGGAFVHGGVPGVYSGRVVNDSTIAFSVGSGKYSFATHTALGDYEA